MYRILSMVLVCLVLGVWAAPAGSQEQQQARQKGVYDEVELTSKDYHLIESSDELHVQLLRRGMLYGDPELDAWLQSIGDRLAPEPTDFYQKYRFYLVRDQPCCRPPRGTRVSISKKESQSWHIPQRDTFRGRGGKHGARRSQLG